MIQRNGSFIAGYMAGRNDRTNCYPFNNYSAYNLTIEYQSGYLAGYDGRGQVVIEFPESFKVGDRVKRTHVITSKGNVTQGPFLATLGTIEATETELGPEYVSVRWDGNDTGFYAQVPKECLVKVD